ncbi:PH domain-containing protein [Lignipirellula cremea]|nr:PH domain-containing protein [Lignipirellula cremea]
MNQAIAGVTPAADAEAITMTVWPSICATFPGRFLGQLYSIGQGGYIVTPGNLFALLTAPIAAALYLGKVAPWFGMRYTITNRRVVVQRGLAAVDERWVDLDRFDRIEISVRPGQSWFAAGDLVFFMGNTETFRLDGVCRPESFKAACIKSQMAYTGIKAALAREARS